MRGLVNALAAGDASKVTDWIAPDQRDDFNSAIDDARSLNLAVSFHVKDFSIGVVTTRGDSATVRYRGDVTACISRPGGNSSTDGAGCHPVQSQSGSQKADTFVCVRRNGAWYVSLSNTSPGG